MERSVTSPEEYAEDVSLCDLPVLSLVKEDHQEQKKHPNDNDNDYDDDDDDDDDKAANDNVVVSESQEEFAFGAALTGGSLSTQSEMCAADDVFFGGQILPLRLSVSSDPIRIDQTRNSRSESMDRGTVAGFRSISSRSSSCSSRSTLNSSSITPGTLITITRVTSEPRLRTRNQFSTHPSPKPQIRFSSARGLERVSSAGRKQKSSMWDFFRLGLVRTPEIELQEIKANLRGNTSTNYAVTRSSSVNDNISNNRNINNSFVISTGGENSNNVAEKQKRRKFLSGCRCSVETVASNAIIVGKSKGNTSNGDHKTTSLKTMKKNSVVRESSSDDQKQKKQEGSRKLAVSHHRTYEWLKELSHANLPMHV
ncbi:hypothetical protein TIFTF001_004683 [Ficus carica]|uniref:Uncharacterized protein n=1 Tax=Ficus carica TaxID=3494 RepID=A0AA88CYB1_FICCA|nr:hypothetical protein TIFTF001_004683 [Ficus carica]